MRKAALAIVIAALATPVCAQISPNVAADDVRLKTDVEVKQEQDREAGYKSGVSKIPDQKGKLDPWGNVRGATTPPSGRSQPRATSK